MFEGKITAIDKIPNSRIETDIVICGGGAGGSMAASILSQRGYRVILLEQGGDPKPEIDFSQREEECLPLLLQEGGGQKTEDLNINVVSGKGLGGSTLHNMNLCKRIDSLILERWYQQGLDCFQNDLISKQYQEVEELIGVIPIQDHQVNQNNLIFERGLKALGYHHKRLSHNRDSLCIGSGFCELGCAYSGKKNARRVLIPKALQHGVQIFIHAKVYRINTKNKAASGVTVITKDGRQVDIHSKKVVLAASAIGSSRIALQSGLKLQESYSHVGSHLHLHPGVAIAGLFDETVEGWKGVPQSVESTQFLDYSNPEQNIWMLPAFVHPAAVATLTPGFGSTWKSHLNQYKHMSILSAVLHDASEGHVRLGKHRPHIIQYELTQNERKSFQKGCKELCKILFAAGAHTVVFPSVSSIVMKHPDEADKIKEEHFLPNYTATTAVHPMGTLRMGTSAKNSVVNTLGKFHEIDNLFVVDGSLFPESIGGPPQLSIYTFAKMISEHI